MRDRILRNIEDNIALKRQMLSDESLLNGIELAVGICLRTLRAGGKILLCGNGGSAADAQHIAAELSGRFQKERPALYAEALTVNSSSLTAISNDYGFDMVFARQLEAMGRTCDVLIAISTSGTSSNVLNALEQARKLGMMCIGLTGDHQDSMAGTCEVVLGIPSADTARVQEAHILVGHMICDLIEKEMFG